MSSPEEKPFESWAVVEVFGHKRYCGLVTEQRIGNGSLIRVDVPETSAHPPFTKLFGQGAIYAITPTSEETARAAAEHSWSTEILPVHIPTSQPALASGAVEGDWDEEMG